jgi:type I restriction enzyme S subunit
MTTSKRILLGEICQFIYGDNLPEVKRSPGSIPVYGSNGVVGLHNHSITDSETIIIGRKGSIGEIHWSNVPCWPIDTTYYIQQKDVNCDLKWLFYILKAIDLKKLNKAAAVPGLNREDAYLQIVPNLPPLDEQKRIAAILDQADRIRRLRRQATQLTDTFLQSVFIEMFGNPLKNPKGWATTCIKDIANIIVPTRDKPKCFDGQIPWVTLPDLEGIFIRNARHNLSHENAQEVGNRVIPEGAVLLSCAGSLGQVAITARDVYANQQFYGLNPKNEIVGPIFLAYSLKMLGEEFFFRLAGVSTIGFYSKEKALNIEIMFPPNDLQDKFTKIVKKTIAIQQEQYEAERQADQLFQSLLHRAFTGQLNIQEAVV